MKDFVMWFPEECYIEFWHNFVTQHCSKEWCDKNWDPETYWFKGRGSRWSAEAIQRAFKPPPPVSGPLLPIPDEVLEYRQPRLSTLPMPEEMQRGFSALTSRLPFTKDVRRVAAATASSLQSIAKPKDPSATKRSQAINRKRGSQNSGGLGVQVAGSNPRETAAEATLGAPATSKEPSVSHEELQGYGCSSSAQVLDGFTETNDQNAQGSSQDGTTAHAATANEGHFGLTEAGDTSGKLSKNQKRKRVNNDSQEMAKKFKCPTCGKAFKQSCNLTAHIRVHTKERPYKCLDCDKSFTQQAHLTTHKLTHTGEKAYQCTTCLKRFYRRDHLWSHELTHTKEKPFRCDQCPMRYTRKEYLKVHVRKIHYGHRQKAWKKE